MQTNKTKWREIDRADRQKKKKERENLVKERRDPNLWMKWNEWCYSHFHIYRFSFVESSCLQEKKQPNNRTELNWTEWTEPKEKKRTVQFYSSIFGANLLCFVLSLFIRKWIWFSCLGCFSQMWIEWTERRKEGTKNL